jgi:restriction system protein
MTVLEAATRVLWQAKEPLQSKELAQRMMAEGLWKTSGLTPESTVAAEIYGHMKGYGDKSPFVLSGPGRFTLGKTHVTSELPALLSYVEGLGHSSKGAGSGSLSFLDAAERVLREIGKGHPMHYAEITREALQHGWLTTSGNTPDATMYASIITDVNRRQVAGLVSRFIRPGPGMVALAEPKELALVDRIQEHNTKVRQRVLEHLLSMPPTDLEKLVGGLMAEMGFVEIEVTPPSGDGGVDARGVLVVADAIRIQMAVQVKRWRKNVQAPVVQGLRGSLGAHERGLIVTTSDFSPGAREEAARPDAMPIALLGRDQLVSLLVQYGIGVTKTELHLIELNENQP